MPISINRLVIALVAAPATLVAAVPLIGQTDNAAGWSVLAIGGHATKPGARIAFAADGAIFGTTGCNRFSGQVIAAPGMITFTTPLAVTRMACTGPSAEQETALLEALSGTIAVAYDPVADQMVLLPSDGATIRLGRTQ